MCGIKDLPHPEEAAKRPSRRTSDPRSEIPIRLAKALNPKLFPRCVPTLALDGEGWDGVMPLGTVGVPLAHSFPFGNTSTLP